MDWGIIFTILVSVVASQVLGFLWYGPLFSKIWMKHMGWNDLSEEEIKEKQAGAVPGYIHSMIVVAFASGMIYSMLQFWGFADRLAGLGSVGGGAFLGFVGWLVFYVPSTSSTRYFEEQPWSLYAINAGYPGVLAVLMGFFAGLFG